LFPAAIRLIVKTGYVATRVIKLWLLPLFAILLVSMCVLQFRSQSHVVEVAAFEVSPEMTNAGYTTNTVSRLFAQQVQNYKDGAAQFRLTERSRIRYAAANSEVDIKVPETDISMATLARYLRNILGIPVSQIAGSCITKNGTLILSVSITDGRSFTVESPWQNLEQIGPLQDALMQAAEKTFLQIEPFTVAVYNYTRKNHEQAMIAIGRCLANKTKDDDHQALALWGRILSDAQNYELAIQKCDESLKLEPDDTYASLDRANALDDWGKTTDALKAYNAIIKGHPKEKNARVDAYIDRGICFWRQNKYQEAITDFKAALAINHQSEAAQAELILTTGESGELSLATEMLEEQMELNPNNYRWYDVYGGLLSGAKNYCKAAEMYSKALSLADDDQKTSDALDNRADSYRNCGELDKSIEDYTHALQIDPNDDRARLNRGVACESSGKFQQAKADFEAVIAHNSQSREGRLAVGDLAKLTTQVATQSPDFSKPIAESEPKPIAKHLLQKAAKPPHILTRPFR